MRNYLIGVVYLLGLLATPAAGGQPAPEPVAAPPPLRLGILPFMAPERIEALYGSLALQLGETLQRRVQLRTRATFADYSKALAERQFDVALVQPFDYVEAADRGDYLPVARISEPLSAVLAVPADSAIRDVSQLRGRTVATIPASATVTLLAMPMLRQAGLDPEREISLQHTRGHDACLLETLQGRAAACITARPAMNLYAARRGLAFRVLHESEALPHILFVVRADYPEAARQGLLAALLEWHASEDGRRLFAMARISGGLVPARDADYDPVRRLRDASPAR
jgi:phosphonate transport system substrate-binding protein